MDHNTVQNKFINKERANIRRRPMSRATGAPPAAAKGNQPPSSGQVFCSYHPQPQSQQHLLTSNTVPLKFFGQLCVLQGRSRNIDLDLFVPVTCARTMPFPGRRRRNIVPSTRRWSASIRHGFPPPLYRVDWVNEILLPADNRMAPEKNDPARPGGGVEEPKVPEPPKPHPSFIQVAKPFVFEQTIQECLAAIGVDPLREESLRLQGVTWIDNVRRALHLYVWI